MAPADKVCARCGRRFGWRSAWAGCWESVRYCSKACRRRRLGALDRALEQAILDLLNGRPRGATICPSEAARALRPESWRGQMERTRQAARRLVHRGQLDITKGGRVVDPSTARGPIRLRLRPQ